MKRNTFWLDDLGMLRGRWLIASIATTLAAVFGLVLLGYYLTGYPVEVANCTKAGGDWQRGFLGGCVYPNGDTTRVHVNGVEPR